METELVSVLVLYVHPLLGRGIEQLLAGDPRLCVRSVPVGSRGAVETALAANPSTVIFEQGGGLCLDELLRQSACPVIVDVSLYTGEVWAMRRDRLSGEAEHVVQGILDACLATRPSPAAQ